MARLYVWTVAALIGLLVFALLSVEPAFAQDPGGGGRPGGGRGGDGRGRMRGEMEKIQKEAEEAAYAAAKKATEAGKTEEEAKEAAAKAADEYIDKRIDEMVERMGQGRGGGGNNPGGGGMPNPEDMKKRIKERMGDTIKEAAGAAADRAIEDYKTKSWKEIEPREELVDEEKKDKEIREAIKGTTLFEDFQHKEETDLEELKLTKPVIIFFYITYDGSKSTEKKVEKCEKMQENVLSDKEFVTAAGEFVRFRMDITKLNTPLKRKYRIGSAPTVVFFDCTGKWLYRFSNTKQKVKTLLKKMESFVEKSDKAKEKAEEAKEKEEEVEEKEEEKEEKEEAGKEEEKEEPKGELGG